MASTSRSVRMVSSSAWGDESDPWSGGGGPPSRPGSHHGSGPPDDGWGDSGASGGFESTGPEARTPGVDPGWDSGGAAGKPSDGWSEGADDWPGGHGGTGRPQDRYGAGGGDLEPSDGVVQPPLVLLITAVVVPLLALPLLLVGRPSVHVLGWAVAVFGSLGFVLAFTARDLRLSTNPWYGGTPEFVPALRLAAVVLGIGVAAVHAWFFAVWASRLDIFAG